MYNSSSWWWCKVKTRLKRRATCRKHLKPPSIHTYLKKIYYLYQLECLADVWMKKICYWSIIIEVSRSSESEVMCNRSDEQEPTLKYLQIFLVFFVKHLKLKALCCCDIRSMNNENGRRIWWIFYLKEKSTSNTPTYLNEPRQTFVFPRQCSVTVKLSIANSV